MRTGLTFRSPLAIANLAVAASAVACVPVAGATFSTHAAAKGLLVGVAALVAAWTAKKAAGVTLFEVALAAFVVFGALSATRAHDAPAAILALIPFVAWLIISRTLRASLGEQKGGVERVADLVALVSAGIACLALLEALGLRLPWVTTARPGSTLLNRNYLAEYLVMALPLVVWRGARHPSPLRIVGILAVVAVIILSRCRGAWLAFVASALVGYLAYWRTGFSRRMGAVIVVGGLAGALIPWPGLSFKEEVTGTAARLLDYQSGSGRVRLQQHQLGWQILRSAPVLGVGPGGYEDAASEHAHRIGRHTSFTRGAKTPNSDWLRIAVEHGIVGLGLILAALAVLGVAAARVARADRGAGPAGAVLASWAAVAICATFDAALFRWEVVGFCAVLTGMTCQRRFSLPTVLSRPVARVAPVALGGALVVVSTSVFASQLLSLIGARHPSERLEWEELATQVFPRSHVSESLVWLYADRGECDRAHMSYLRARSAAPHHWGAPFTVARCYGKEPDTHASARELWRQTLRVEPHAAELSSRVVRRPEVALARRVAD